MELSLEVFIWAGNPPNGKFSEKFLRRAVDSALGQNYGNKKITVLCPDRYAFDIARGLSTLPVYEVRLIASCKSQANAFNGAVANSKADVFTFIDGAAYWIDEDFALASISRLEESAADFSYSGALLVDRNFNVCGSYDAHIGAFPYREPFALSGMFIRRESFICAGKFETDTFPAHGYALEAALLAKGFCAVDSGRVGVAILDIDESAEYGIARQCVSKKIHLLADMRLKESQAEAYAKSFSSSMEHARFLSGFIYADYFSNFNFLLRRRGFLPSRKRRILFDVSLLVNAFKMNSRRSGVFFAAFNIYKRILKSEIFEPYFYVGESVSKTKVLKVLKECIFCGEYFNARFLDKKNLAIVDMFFSPWGEIPRSVREAGLPCVSILYDTIPLIFPQFYPGIETGRHFYSNMIRSYSRKDHFFAISEHTKKDFSRLVRNVDPKSIYVCPLAASEEFSRVEDSSSILAVRAKYGIPNGAKYIFSLCSIEPRKNLVYAVKNFVKFLSDTGAKDMFFVLGGSQWDAFAKILDSEIKNMPEYSDRILKIGYVADEDLPALYSGAFCFIYPSLYEGFGLPPLEAMRCGCAVITSDNSSLPEVVGGGGIMVDITEPYAVAEELKKLYSSPAKLAELRSACLLKSAQFSWEKCSDAISLGLLKIALPQRSEDFPGECKYLPMLERRNIEGGSEYRLFGIFRLFKRKMSASLDDIKYYILDIRIMQVKLRRDGAKSYRLFGIIPIGVFRAKQ